MERIEKIKLAASTIESLIDEWEPILEKLPIEVITQKRNSQNRNIKQILGHLIDSGVNNHHRIVRLQYQKRLSFPDYQPDNDTWIQIQNYEGKDWQELILVWKYYSRHIAFIIQQVEELSLNNLWSDGFIAPISLEDIIVGFPEHFKLHLNEIQELISQ
jgi:hypothetical protein